MLDKLLFSSGSDAFESNKVQVHASCKLTEVLLFYIFWIIDSEN